MADLIIDDDLLQRLREIARKENRPVEDVLRAMVEKYAPEPDNHETLQSMIDSYRARVAETDPLEAFLGMFDDEVGNLSETVRDTMKAYYREKYGNTD